MSILRAFEDIALKLQERDLSEREALTELSDKLSRSEATAFDCAIGVALAWNLREYDQVLKFKNAYRRLAEQQREVDDPRYSEKLQRAKMLLGEFLDDEMDHRIKEQLQCEIVSPKYGGLLIAFLDAMALES